MENEPTTETTEETEPTLGHEVATTFALATGTAVGMVVGAAIVVTVKNKLDARRARKAAAKITVVEED